MQKINPKKKYTLYITRSQFVILLVVLFYFVSLISNHVVNAEKINCSDFQTQGGAQIAYNTNPIKYAKLDRNNDGKVCQTLPKYSKRKTFIQKLIDYII